MNKFKKTIATGAATAAMITQLAFPAFATTTIEITGNGDSTDNDAQVNVTQTTAVVQDNTSNITNTVNVEAETGENKANSNTGGDTHITTGNAKAEVVVANEAGTNVADVNGCNCDQDAEVVISGNGVDSDNDATLGLTNATNIFQDNKTTVNNDVDVDADSGDNEANSNTGGDVSINTGSATVATHVLTAANTNVARNGNGNHGGGMISARIVGNGDNSDNDLNLTHMRTVLLDQDNVANVTNDVDVEAETGENEANSNTNGMVDITTGDADFTTIVDNMLNFNAADLDCGCMLNVAAKVAENGKDSNNTLKANLVDDLQNFQNNNDRTNNDIDADGETGENKSNSNTGDAMGDPSITTGDSEGDVRVYNTNNVNQLGDVGMNGYDMGTSVSISFDLNDLLSMLLGL